MKNKSNKKTLAIVLVVLALVLVGGFAYAAITGTLFFTGTSTLQGRGPDTVQLQFHSVEGSVTNPSGSNAKASLVAVDGLANQKIVVEATFLTAADFGDKLTIPFSLENTGNRPVRVTKERKVETSSNPDYYIHADTTLKNVEYDLFVIEPGEISETWKSVPLCVEILLDGSAVIPEDDVTFSFELELEYEEWTGAN